MGLAGGAWSRHRSGHDSIEKPSAFHVAAAVDPEMRDQSRPGLSARYRGEQMDDSTIAAINAMMCDPLERIWHDR